jgi:8-oxo-dGTP diphosphatase
VGGVITDSRGRLLLIKRGHEPGAGLWSLPGGRIEPGETDAEALVREMREETGLEVEPGPLLGAVQRPTADGGVLDIRDYAATVTRGILTPGDDAADTRWVSEADLYTLAITDGLVEALTSWGVLGQGQHWSSHFRHFNADAAFSLRAKSFTVRAAYSSEQADHRARPTGRGPALLGGQARAGWRLLILQPQIVILSADSRTGR